MKEARTKEWWRNQALALLGSEDKSRKSAAVLLEEVSKTGMCLGARLLLFGGTKRTSNWRKTSPMVPFPPFLKTFCVYICSRGEKEMEKWTWGRYSSEGGEDPSVSTCLMSTPTSGMEPHLATALCHPETRSWTKGQEFESPHHVV